MASSISRVRRSRLNFSARAMASSRLSGPVMGSTPCCDWLRSNAACDLISPAFSGSGCTLAQAASKAATPSTVASCQGERRCALPFAAAADRIRPGSWPSASMFFCRATDEGLQATNLTMAKLRWKTSKLQPSTRINVRPVKMNDRVGSVRQPTHGSRTCLLTVDAVRCKSA